MSKQILCCIPGEQTLHLSIKGIWNLIHIFHSKALLTSSRTFLKTGAKLDFSCNLDKDENYVQLSIYTLWGAWH